jgi:hypothetical protein
MIKLIILILGIMALIIMALNVITHSYYYTLLLLFLHIITVSNNHNHHNGTHHKGTTCNDTQHNYSQQ